MVSDLIHHSYLTRPHLKPPAVGVQSFWDGEQEADASQTPWGQKRPCSGPFQTLSYSSACFEISFVIIGNSK